MEYLYMNDPENIMLSERNQMQTVKCYTIPFTLNVKSSQVYKNRKHISGFSGRKEWRVTTNAYGVSFVSEKMFWN